MRKATIIIALLLPVIVLAQIGLNLRDVAFVSRGLVDAGEGVTNEVARPIADADNTGTWLNSAGGSSPLWSYIDDPIETGDADLVMINGPSASTPFTVDLSETLDPATNINHQIRFRAAVPEAATAYDIICELRQGYTSEASQGTLIVAAGLTNESSGSAISVTNNLTTAQADSITDYSDLQFRFYGAKNGGGGGQTNFIYDAEFQVQAAASPPPATEFAFLEAHETNGFLAGQTWTRSAVDIGAADADRQIIVVITARNASIDRPDVMTVGGVTATVLHTNIDAGSPYFITHIYKADVPTGTTADIALSHANVADWSAMAFYRLVNFQSTTYDVAGHLGSSTTINVEENGVIIGGVSSATGGPANTPTGLTEDWDVGTNAGADGAAGGSHEATSDETGRTIQLDMGGDPNEAAAFVSISPDP